MLPFYQALYERFDDLHTQIKSALESVPADALDWSPGAEMNSVSVIISHLTGAERFLVGDIIMGEPSNRNRDAEFKAKGLSKRDLIKRLDDAETYLKAAFDKLTMADLDATRIHPRHGNQVTVSWALLHALDHVAIHAGHIQITVQLNQLPEG